MKLKRLVFLITVVLATQIGLLACDKAKPLSGSSSGGGGYGDESANLILDEAIERLSQKIHQASEQVYSDLPKGVSRDKLLKIIKNVRREPNTQVSRNQRDLMFNYVDSSTEKYIYATRAFYKAYAGEAIYYGNKKELLAKIEEIEIRLLHEAAHLFKIGNSETTDLQARRFAVAMHLMFNEDTYFCFSETAHPQWTRYVDYEREKKARESNGSADWDQKYRYVWLINRPTSEGILNTSLSLMFASNMVEDNANLEMIRDFKRDFSGQDYNVLSKELASFQLIQEGGKPIVIDFNETNVQEKPFGSIITFSNSTSFLNFSDSEKKDKLPVEKEWLSESVIIKSNSKGDVIEARVEFETLISTKEMMSAEELQLKNRVTHAEYNKKPINVASRKKGKFEIQCKLRETNYLNISGFLTDDVLRRGY
ncbi:MAG: hypothetical protein H6625_06710 [Bdellovibrionaceae bacterium]|nr:hypothetical protein [Pseudobdellovibrionaceae bacterium]